VEKELNIAKTLALKAGEKILEIYHSSDFGIEMKSDNSPLTKADLEANKIITEGLRSSFPSYGILTEEEADNDDRLSKEFVWIIDPVDGTKEFISKSGEFTVNIALVQNGQPIIGVVYVPVKDQLFYGSKNAGAFLDHKGETNKIEVSAKNIFSDMIIAISKTHATKELDILEKHKFAGVIKCGSSIKGCMVAKGDADVYFRFGPTREWDVCAMHGVLLAAGGIMTNIDGSPMCYNRTDTLNGGFVISNNKIHDKLLSLVKEV